MILAAFVQADSVMTIFYMIIGMVTIGLWWNNRAIKKLKLTRVFDHYAFLNQEVKVKLEIVNGTRLPIIWLGVHESLPVNLRSGAKFNQVISLLPNSRQLIIYPLYALKRGYYKIGPTFVTSGDMLGITKASEVSFPEDFLTIFPRIVNLEELGLPTISPFGTIKHNDPIFEDPSRNFGKRDYQIGDPQQRIDWKSTAASRGLQVKQFEASIALESYLLLDLDQENYDIKKRYDASEKAIVIAASLANWSIKRKQPIGFCTNGIDPISDNQSPLPIMPHKGNPHLQSILDILARIEMTQERPLSTIFQEIQTKSSYGSTIVIITGAYTRALLNQILQTKKGGKNIVLILVGHVSNHAEAENHAKQFGFICHYILKTIDLQIINQQVLR